MYTFTTSFVDCTERVRNNNNPLRHAFASPAGVPEFLTGLKPDVERTRGAAIPDLWATEIVPLLDLRDLVRIDTAIVSKSGRDGFSAVLNYHCVQVDDCRVKGNVADTFRWINERCIKVDAVKIARDRITALCAVDQLLRFAGSISVSFSNVVECMAGGWQHVSSNTLSRVNELAIHAPFRSGEDPFFIDKDRIVAETIQRFPRLSKLTIGLCGSVGHYMCQALSSSGSLLEEFSVIPYVVSSAMQVIATLANSCPQLRRFFHCSTVSPTKNLPQLIWRCWCVSARFWRNCHLPRPTNTIVWTSSGLPPK
jgi:hypothetical protein